MWYVVVSGNKKMGISKDKEKTDKIFQKEKAKNPEARFLEFKTRELARNANNPN